jgi:hypothetical protein
MSNDLRLDAWYIRVVHKHHRMHFNMDFSARGLRGMMSKEGIVDRSERGDHTYLYI